MFEIFLRGILSKKGDPTPGDGPVITLIEEGPGSLTVHWQYIPGEPTFTYTTTINSITFTITDVHDGHLPIIRYEYNLGSGWTSIGTNTTRTISGLSEGTYQLRTRAVNSMGIGIESDPVSITLTDEPVSNWILATGSWNDQGEWDDNEQWKDS